MMKVTAAVDIAEIPIAVAFDKLATQTGVADHADLKFSVQAVTVPLPSVMTPFVSVPDTLGLPVPQVVADVGLAPVEAI